MNTNHHPQSTLMNDNLFRPNPTVRDAHALRQRVEEIHSFTRDLRDRADAPPVAGWGGGEASRAAVTECGAGKSGAKFRPPAVTEIPVAPSPPAAPSEARTAVVSSSVPAREPVALPPVADLRPELVAFTAAITQQHAAAGQTLRQVTELCRSQLVEIKRLSEELGKLERQLRTLAQRP